MNRHYPARYATPELAKQGRKAAREKRRREEEEAAAAKLHAELLEKERQSARIESAIQHEKELDAPAEPDLD